MKDKHSLMFAMFCKWKKQSLRILNGGIEDQLLINKNSQLSDNDA